jgi:hypothetical protein
LGVGDFKGFRGPQEEEPGQEYKELKDFRDPQEEEPGQE